MMTETTQVNWAERRDSIRVPVEMMVRSYDQDRFEACQGDLSLGGARILFHRPPSDRQVEVLFQAPGSDSEVRLQGDVIGLRKVGMEWEARVRFLDWDLRDELALARMLHDASAEWEDWSGEHALS